jgi:hypothetical protein
VQTVVVVVVVNLLSGESRWNGLPTLQGLDDGMLMGRLQKPTPGTQSRGAA